MKGWFCWRIYMKGWSSWRSIWKGGSVGEYMKSPFDANVIARTNQYQNTRISENQKMFMSTQNEL